MSHTTDYPADVAVRRTASAPADPVAGFDAPASDDASADAPRKLSGWAALLLGLIFVVMGGVGGAGAYGTYRNMKSAFGDGGTALGVVAAGEGAVAVLGLTLIGLTLISRPYPLPLRLGLWAIPAAGSAAGSYVATDGRHAAVYAVTPLAMTCAAELAGYLARSIVVYSTGTDAEADRRTGETLRMVEFHRARAQHHPDPKVRERSEVAAWRLARRVGRGDPRLGAALTQAYSVRTTQAALTALDHLYGRTDAAPAAIDAEPLPTASPAPLPVLPAPVRPTAVEPEPVIDTAPVEAASPWPPEPTHPASVAVEPLAAVEPHPAPKAEYARIEVPGQLPFDAFDAPVDEADAFDAGSVETDEDTDAYPIPVPGERMSDVELDAVVHMIRTETDPPRTQRGMEERFRELGYIASAARLRAAWDRVIPATADLDS